MRILSYRSTQLHDITYSGVELMTWSTVEQAVGIVCACLVVFRPLLLSYCKRLKRRCQREETIRSFGGQLFDSEALHNREPLEMGHMCPSKTDRPIDEDETSTASETLQRPISALIGVAISTPAIECSFRDGNSSIHGAINQGTKRLSGPMVSCAAPHIIVPPPLAAFHEQTRGLGQPWRNVF